MSGKFYFNYPTALRIMQSHLRCLTPDSRFPTSLPAPPLCPVAWARCAPFCIWVNPLPHPGFYGVRQHLINIKWPRHCCPLRALAKSVPSDSRSEWCGGRRGGGGLRTGRRLAWQFFPIAVFVAPVGQQLQPHRIAVRPGQYSALPVASCSGTSYHHPAPSRHSL